MGVGRHRLTVGRGLAGVMVASPYGPNRLDRWRSNLVTVVYPAVGGHHDLDLSAVATGRSTSRPIAHSVGRVVHVRRDPGDVYAGSKFFQAIAPVSRCWGNTG